jgi:predicted dehydrogenase
LKKFKIGIIGAGFTAEQYHIPAWNKIKNCDVHAVCDIDKHRLDLTQNKFNIKNAFFDYRDMLSDNSLDIITITTPTYCHYQQIIDSLNSGMHVTVEKPMALSYEECLDAIDVSDKNRRKLMCLQQNRFKNSTKKLHEVIGAGELGEIYYASASSIRSRGVPAAKHFLCESSKGGGPLYDSGAHIIDIAWYLMGKPVMKSVVANCWNRLATSNTIRIGDSLLNSDNYHCEDMVAAHLQFDNGCVLSIEISYLANMPFSKKRECLLWGTNGGAYWPNAEIYINDGESVITKKLDILKQNSLGVEMLKSFMNSIIRDETVEVDPHDSAQVVRMIQSIHESCRYNYPS